MKKLAKLVPLVSLLFLVGCKSGINVPVTTADLNATPPIETEGLLYLEVTTCTERETKEESSYVKEAQKAVKETLPDAEYLTCKRQGFDSFVQFEVPVSIGKLTKEIPCKPDEICIRKNDSGVVMVLLGKNVREKATRSRGSSTSDFKPREFKIQLDFANKEKDSIKLQVPSAMIEMKGKDEPYHVDVATIPKRGKANIRLSEVASVKLFKDGGVIAFFENQEEKQEQPKQEPSKQ